MEYEFTLTYRLATEDSNMQQLVERLGESGCEDALVGTGRPGRIALNFCRESVSAREAIRTALADVETALPSATLIEAAPDLVGLTEIADTVGISRQGMRKLMLTHTASFPTPIHEGSASIWHLADVLHWLADERGYEIEKCVAEVARETLEVNLTTQAQRYSVASVSLSSGSARLNQVCDVIDFHDGEADKGNGGLTHGTRR